MYAANWLPWSQPSLAPSQSLAHSASFVVWQGFYKFCARHTRSTSISVRIKSVYSGFLTDIFELHINLLTCQIMEHTKFRCYCESGGLAETIVRFVRLVGTISKKIYEVATRNGLAYSNQKYWYMNCTKRKSTCLKTKNITAHFIELRWASCVFICTSTRLVK